MPQLDSNGVLIDYFDSARIKFTWASELKGSLKKDVLDYVGRNPYETVIESNANATGFLFRLKVKEQMPSVRWGLRLSDCLQNYRSALDHAICELAARWEKRFPRPSVKEHVLQFPICDTESKFQASLHNLGGMKSDDHIRACVEGLQPYNRPNGGFRPALSLLRDLNNAQKHRVTTLVHSARQKGEFTVNNPRQVDVAPIWRFFAGPVSDGAQFLGIDFDEPQPGMTVAGNFVFFPALGHPATLRSKPLGAEVGFFSELLPIEWFLDTIEAEVEHALGVLISAEGSVLYKKRQA